jgi:hypothetical protein
MPERFVIRRHPKLPWLVELAVQFRSFVDSLPAQIEATCEVDGDFVSLCIKAPTHAHRELNVEASPGEIQYALGRVWTEQIDPTPDNIREMLAACDAVRDGLVREVRDRRTGVIYDVYRLRTRGYDKYLRDSQYSLWHWLRLRVRRVKIHRLPPLATIVL